MTMHQYDGGGTRRDVKSIHVYDAGGTRRDIKGGYIYDASGTRRQFFNSVIVPPFTGFASIVTPGTSGGTVGYVKGLIGSLSVSIVPGTSIELTRIANDDVAEELRIVFSGFSSDPGSSWFASVNVNVPGIGLKLTASVDAYNFNAGVAEWIWIESSQFVNGSPAQATFS